VSVVSITDEMEAKRLGPLGMALVAKLRAIVDRDTDRELAKRRRRIEELSGREVVPVHPLLPTSPPNSKRADGIDFRPYGTARFEVSLLGESLHAIRDELVQGSAWRVRSTRRSHR
jgi:hypothetical protein